MKILIWTQHPEPLGQMIAALTHGPGYHAAFLRASGVVHEAFWPRLRERAVTRFDRANAEVFELAGVTREEHLEFEHLFNYNLSRNITYSIGDLFRFACNRPSRDEHHTFCSRYVMHCLHAVLADDQMPLVRLPAGDWASPRDLRISPRLRLLADDWKTPAVPAWVSFPPTQAGDAG